MRLQRTTAVIAFGLLTLFRATCADGGHAWGYEGETGDAHWPDMVAECGGMKQSPIDIDNSQATFDDTLPDIDVVPETSGGHVTQIQNNGHSLVMTTEAEILVNGGNLPATYKAAQAHFHWGSSSTQGSEHTIDGKAYPLEMHMVTYNTEYESTVTANGLGPLLTGDDESALAVLGVFFTLSANNNTKLDPLIAVLDQATQSNSDPVAAPGFYPWELLPGTLRNYYRYQGSLTTPTCNEVVLWTLFEEKSTISEYQLNKLRSLQDEHNHALQDNYRRVQALNGRQVSRSFQHPSYTVTNNNGIGDGNGAAATQYTMLAMTTALTLVKLLA